MAILSWLLFGLLAGAMAKKIHRGPDPGGWLITSIIGILGAFLGGYLGALITGNNPMDDKWSFSGFLFAVMGAFILLWLYAKMKKK